LHRKSFCATGRGKACPPDPPEVRPHDASLPFRPPGPPGSARLAPLALLLLLLALPGAAGAKELGVFKDWAAHQLDSDSGTICFMESRPSALDAKPADRKAETTRVTVTHRPKKGVFHALLFETGYPLDDKVLAEIAIDGNVYKMGTDAGGYFYLSEIKDEQAAAGRDEGRLQAGGQGHHARWHAGQRRLLPVGLHRRHEGDRRGLSRSSPEGPSPTARPPPVRRGPDARAPEPKGSEGPPGDSPPRLSRSAARQELPRASLPR
jgi:hypothetical protein